MPDITTYLKRTWISPEGEVIEMPTGVQPAYYAKRYYLQKGIDLTPPEAVEKFFQDGWIRMQVKPEQVSLEGIEPALIKNGERACMILPDFKRLIFYFTDTGKYKQVNKERVQGRSWSDLVKEASKGLIADE